MRTIDVRLPKLADTLVEGTVSRWLKSPGQSVRKGDPLVEIDTEKVASELEAPVDGILAEIVVGEGRTVPVGEVIARIQTSADFVPQHEPPDAAAIRAEPTAPSQTGLSSMRRRIAERMQASRTTIPQGACVREVALETANPGRPRWSALFVKALASAAGIENVGIAVEVPEGLLVPVIKGVGEMGLPAIAQAIDDLARRAREGSLTPDDVGGASFTLTNVGGVGTLMAFPLVPPGQRGILATGAVRDGRCYLTLCYDRRELDEYAADRLLARIEQELLRTA